MRKTTDYITAREILLGIIRPIETEKIPLSETTGRILAAPLEAGADVPAFDRSSMDGYALRSADTANTSETEPVTLKILEEVPAGFLPSVSVKSGECIKILTGSPIPEGADAVVRFENVEFSESEITITHPVKSGNDIVYKGEDVKKGRMLAEAGIKIDDGLAAALSAQDNLHPEVFRKPKVAIISTGTEILEEDEALTPGKIRNTSRYALTNALERVGCTVTFLGTVKDDENEIAGLINEGLLSADVVITTGGVSVGDYDLTPKAMELAGAEVLIQGVGLKPGRACAFGTRDGKIISALSGNPASALMVYYTVVLPCIRKLAGYKEPVPEIFEVIAGTDFEKKSTMDRLLRGTLRFEDGKVMMDIPKGQGGVMISNTVGCNVATVVPAGSGPIKKGDTLHAFMV